MKKILLMMLVLFMLMPAAFAASLEELEPVPLPSVLVMPISDNSEIKDNHQYISDSITARYNAKFTKDKFVLIPGQSYIDWVKQSATSATGDARLINAGKGVGAKYVVATEIQKVVIKRGIKWGFITKKWCTAEMPVKIIIMDVESGRKVYESVITETGKKEATVGFVSDEATIKTALAAIEPRIDKEVTITVPQK